MTLGPQAPAIAEHALCLGRAPRLGACLAWPSGNLHRPVRGRHRGSLQPALCSVTCWSHHLLASQSTAPRGAGMQRAGGGGGGGPVSPHSVLLSSCPPPGGLHCPHLGGTDEMGRLQQHPRYRKERINVCEQNGSCRSCVHCNKTNGRCSLRGSVMTERRGFNQVIRSSGDSRDLAGSLPGTR